MLSLLLCALPSDPAQAAASLPVERRVLVYTVSAGFEHDVAKRPAPGELALVERALLEIASASGRFEAVVSRDAASFEAESLARFGAVFFYTTGELPLSVGQRTALLDFVKKGGGFAGAHCASDTYYEVPEYGEMVGGYFDGHPWHEKVRVEVEDAKHLATAHLAPSFEIVDEIYQHRAPYDRAKLHVLMRLDREATDFAKDGVKRTDRDIALAWTKSHGDGRVFYTALGHRPEVWADPRFRLHLEGGLRWVLRDDPKDDAEAERERYRAFALANGGDPARGIKVFRRESGPMCARCHAVYGTGGIVGPDLSDVGLRSTKEALVASILEPSRTIEPSYRATTFELADGRVVFGRVLRETASVLELADTDGKTVTLAPSEITSRRESDVSVMPSGLAALLTREEFADLVAYVATLRTPPAPK